MKKPLLLILLMLSDFAFAKKMPTFGPYSVKVHLKISKNSPKPKYQDLKIKAENVTTGVSYQVSQVDRFNLSLPPGFYRFTLLDSNCGAESNLVEVMGVTRVILMADCSDYSDYSEHSLKPQLDYNPNFVID